MKIDKRTRRRIIRLKKMQAAEIAETEAEESNRLASLRRRRALFADLPSPGGTFTAVARTVTAADLGPHPQNPLSGD